MTESFNVEVLFTGQNRMGNAAQGVTQDLNRVTQSVRNTNDGMGAMERNLQRVRTALDLGIAGHMLGRVQRFAEEFNELGDNVRRAHETFVALSGGAEQAASGLETMRAATGGIVDNMTLMKSANQLLLTGLAQTHEQAARLTTTAVRLGGALGHDAAASIENLNAALLNNSFVRLDTLGISATAVRERVRELTAAGMDMSAAFAQATMEEGEQAILALGDAAFTAESPILRLQTDIENLHQQLAENFNVGVNATVNLLYAMGDAAEVNAIRTRRALEGAELLGRQAEPLTILGYQFNLASGVNEQDLATGTHLMDFRDQQQEIINQVFANTFANSSIFQGVGDFGSSTFSRFQDIAAALTPAVDSMATLIDLQSSLNPLFDAGAAAWERTRAAVLQVEAAYSNMSLTEALGEGGGNQLISDLNAQILQEVAERGLLDTAAMQDAADAFNLASGDWTQATITMRDNVVPTLARLVETAGADVAAQRAGQVEEAIRRMNAMGMDPNSMGAQMGLQLATGTIAGIDFQSILEPFAQGWEDVRSRYMDFEGAAGGMEASLAPGEAALGRMMSTTDTLQHNLDTMTKKKYNIDVEVRVTLTGDQAGIGVMQGGGFNPQTYNMGIGNPNTPTRDTVDMRGRTTGSSSLIPERTR